VPLQVTVSANVRTAAELSLEEVFLFLKRECDACF